MFYLFDGEGVGGGGENLKKKGVSLPGLMTYNCASSWGMPSRKMAGYGTGITSRGGALKLVWGRAQFS